MRLWLEEASVKNSPSIPSYPRTGFTKSEKKDFGLALPWETGHTALQGR